MKPRLTETEIIDDILQQFALARPQIEPGVHNGSMGRSAIAWLLYNGIGYTYADIASCLMWSSERAAEYAVAHAKKGRWDNHPKIGGRTMTEYLYSRLHYLQEKYQRGSIGYGHTPLD